MLETTTIQLYNKLRRYSITEEDYIEMIRQQDHSCAICGCMFISGNLPIIDHDHSCCPNNGSCGRCIRGLLCRNCNLTLGRFKDDPEWFDSAVSYLRSNLAS